MQKKRLVSACLLGIECRWNGKSKPNDILIKKFQEGELIPVCPEQLGGLPTPRMPSEVVNGSGKRVIEGKNIVVDKEGIDVTGGFVKGAKEALKIARLAGATEFIAADKSPSCGKGRTYDGSFSGKLVRGDGVTAAIFKKNGIKVINVKELDNGLFDI